MNKAKSELKRMTGKELIIKADHRSYSKNTVMYSMRNKLRKEFRKVYPTEQKVFFYFPVDDEVRPIIVNELYRLAHSDKPCACMFKFMVKELNKTYTAATRPITSYTDIHPSDWGGYCAYNILTEEACPLYPKIAIPNVAFYIELYKAGYEEYLSKETCIDHLRHLDSHHFKYKDTSMSKIVSDYLLTQREILSKKDKKPID